MHRILFSECVSISTVEKDEINLVIYQMDAHLRINQEIENQPIEQLVQLKIRTLFRKRTVGHSVPSRNVLMRRQCSLFCENVKSTDSMSDSL